VSDWGVSLGMHNFRRAERETLRVLEASFPVEDALVYKGEKPLSIVKNPSGGGVASSKRLSPRKRFEKVKPKWTELPLAYVRPTRSRFRRLRKVKGRRTSVRNPDSKVGTVWEVIPRQAKTMKIPVKGAFDAPKDYRYWSLPWKRKQAIVEFWLRARIRRCRPLETAWHGGPAYTAFASQRCTRIVERIGGNLTVEGMVPLSIRIRFRRWEKRGDEIVRELVDDLYKALVAQLVKKEVFERRDVSRRENRRRFIRWCIGKHLSDNVKRSFTKRQMRQTLFKVLDRRHGFHTHWLASELSVRGRRDAVKGKGTSMKTSRSSSPESVFDFSELRLSRYRRNTYGNTSYRLGIKAQSHEIASIRPYGC